MMKEIFNQGISENLKSHYAQNAADLKAMYVKSMKTGKKVNGYTSDELFHHYNRYEILSKGIWID